jgi:tetratricopeptide (TPR) repeat protein
MVAPFLLAASLMAAPPALETARDFQDRAALAKLAAEAAAAAARAPKDARAQYEAALAASYFAEVALELRDRKQAQQASEEGIRFAERAVALDPANGEYYRILGTLCGQVIPANPLMGALNYGKRAREAINKAVELGPRSPAAYLARGVGNYYLPAAFGGGTELAIADFRKAMELDARGAEAYLWLGLSLRKAGRNAEARQALEKSLAINPRRVWVKQQLEKTPLK